MWIVALTTAAFVMQLIFSSPWLAEGERMLSQLPLTIPSLQSGYVWTLLTHGLVHSTGTPFPILFTILGLIFIGRELEPLLGAKRFVWLYVGALVVGALAWSAIHWTTGGIHLGSEAAICGLFVVLALLYPNQDVNFLVFFLIPVRVRPLYLVYGLALVDTVMLLVFEVHGGSSYAASAHLGGMVTGWLYYRFFHASHGMDRAAGVSLEMPAWLRRSKPTAKTSPVSKSTPISVPKSPVNLRAEVDRILDKINSDGFGALTEDEKRVLDDAKDMLSRS